LDSKYNCIRSNIIFNRALPDIVVKTLLDILVKELLEFVSETFLLRFLLGAYPGFVSGAKLGLGSETILIFVSGL
jgi:hypothetical protein